MATECKPIDDEECKIFDYEVEIAVEKYLGTKPSKLDYTIKQASAAPLGFIGDHVRIVGTAVANGQEKHIQFFAKKIPTKMKQHKEYAEGTKAFYKEIEMYKTLFDDFQKAVTPGRADSRWGPTCYYTRDHDLLIVEDLSQEHYYMLPERSFMGIEHMRATIIVMARMHAASFIFEEKLNAGQATTHSPNFSPNQGKVSIRDLYPNLIFESECSDIPGHVGYIFWEVGIASQNTLVDYLPGYTAEQKERIKKGFPDAMRQVYDMLKPSDKFRNVMIHADLWGNNILFRNDPDGKVLDAILVDYQMTRYAPPAQDLFMLFHIVQNKPFRDANEKELVDFYYDSLKHELAVEGFDINQLLPRQEFDESCIFYKRYAILNQIIYTQINIAPPDIVDKFMSNPEAYNRMMTVDRSDILIECFLTDDLCRESIIEAMVEVIEICNLA